ncbi:hypothetical protein FDP41_002228 [Naegleria fowleri]|uniref:Uncharacterized protein n=1 Tax=Naegleria fowleri TaxID=5763 RepID=A0A6A5BX99_NAEFO|nr:uncharacterized protein FDP41_002228 [Naegleria fowleri]KAF0978408.1 hypothetical protein FDP41_002228 [Naegleria fowleri]
MEAALQINSAHAHQLFQHRVIAFNFKWQAIPHEQLKLNPNVLQDGTHDEHLTPRMVIFLLEPHNKYLSTLDNHHEIETNENSSSDPALGNSSSSCMKEISDLEFIQRYTKQVDQAREGFDEYFDYLKKHQLVSSLKVHDSYYERWTQFNQQYSKDSSKLEMSTETSQPFSLKDIDEGSFVFLVKTLNDGTLALRGDSKHSMKYDVSGTLAFSVKHVVVNGEFMKMGLTGSGWVPPKFRGIHETKLIPWFLHLYMFKEMGVRYYAHVFEENTRCLGFVEKTGLFPSKLRMNFIGVKLPLSTNAKEMSSNASITRVDTFDKFNSLMRKLYGTGNFLVDRLENIYFHPNFEGCFLDEKNNFTFQIWKGKYGVDAISNEQYPAFMIMNMTQAHAPIDVTCQQLEIIQNYLQNDLIPKLILSRNFTNTSHTYLYHVTNSHAMKIALCERYLDHPSLSVAFLAYTFQDNDMFMHYIPKSKNSSETSSTTAPSVPKSEPVWNFVMGEYITFDKNMNLFLDPRDCTSKPLVWSEDIKCSLSLLGDKKLWSTTSGAPSTSIQPQSTDKTSTDLSSSCATSSSNNSNVIPQQISPSSKLDTPSETPKHLQSAFYSSSQMVLNCDSHSVVDSLWSEKDVQFVNLISG